MVDIKPLLICFGLLFCMSIPVSLFPERMIYFETTRNKTLTNITEISNLPGGLHVKTWMDMGNIMDYNLDDKNSIIEWHYININDKTDVILKRKTNQVQVEGIFKKNEIHKIIAITEDPWIEDWGLGLRDFIQSNHTVMCFWSIDPDDLSSYSRFRAVKTGTEWIIWNGVRIEAVHIRINLTGVLEYFWEADFWLRAGDGRELRNKLKRGFGVSDTIIELNQEL